MTCLKVVNNDTFNFKLDVRNTDKETVLSMPYEHISVIVRDKNNRVILRNHVLITSDLAIKSFEDSEALKTVFGFMIEKINDML